MKSKKQRLKIKLDLLLRDKILLKYPNCLVCGKVATQAHHFFPRSSSFRLRFYPLNLISLCQSCHFAHHTKSDPRIHIIIKEKMGIEWYNDLLGKRDEILKNTLVNLREIEMMIEGYK